MQYTYTSDWRASEVSDPLSNPENGDQRYSIYVYICQKFKGRVVTTCVLNNKVTK